MLLSRPSRGTQETIQEIKKKNWWRICKMLRRNLKLRRCKTCKSTSIILSQPPGYITFDCFVCKFVCCLLWQMHIIFLMPLNIKYVSQLDICFLYLYFKGLMKVESEMLQLNINSASQIACWSVFVKHWCEGFCFCVSRLFFMLVGMFNPDLLCFCCVWVGMTVMGTWNLLNSHIMRT